jgi:hypothetical protein
MGEGRDGIDDTGEEEEEEEESKDTTKGDAGEVRDGEGKGERTVGADEQVRLEEEVGTDEEEEEEVRDDEKDEDEAHHSRRPCASVGNDSVEPNHARRFRCAHCVAQRPAVLLLTWRRMSSAR